MKELLVFRANNGKLDDIIDILKSFVEKKIPLRQLALVLSFEYNITQDVYD